MPISLVCLSHAFFNLCYNAYKHTGCVDMVEPAYRRLLHDGTLVDRVRRARESVTHCDLCAWECHADRTDKPGSCRTGTQALVSSAFPHLGEEDPLRGWHGSGTIFFAQCNLCCQYCQNYDISQAPNGQAVNPDQLAAIMLDLQAQGCHNINFVSPSHVIAPIIAAVLLAAQAGLNLPLVYNTGGYDSLAGLALLDGIIDIYMPDMKYADAHLAQHYSRIPDYPARNQTAVREMHRQVGDLQIDARGLATRGLLVRHLVLPGGVAGTAEIVRFLAEKISPHTYINVMGQYRPAWHIAAQPGDPLNRPVTLTEVVQAEEMARQAGLRLDQRARAYYRWW